MKKVVNSILFFAYLIFSAYSQAETVVIVHPSNTSDLPVAEISKIFLGKQSTFANGGEAVPVNLAEGNATRDAFDNTVLGKNARQIKAYWSKLVFTGKGTPPKEVESDEKVIELVSKNPNVIGYIDAASASDKVKVVHKF